MLTFYLSMVETEEDEDKVIYIYNHFYSAMSYAASLVLKNNKHDVDDVVHSSMVNIIKNIDIIDFSDLRRAKSMCKTVAHNMAVDFLKKKENQNISLDDAICDDIEDYNNPAEIVINNDIYAIIERKIKALDDKYRDVCKLKYINNLKEREIALLLNLPPNTVSVRIYRGKQILREELRKEGIHV